MSSKGNFRASWHDYRSKAKYMITLMKSAVTPRFGEVCNFGNGHHIMLSSIGMEVKSSIMGVKEICSSMRLWQYIVMPDHVHFLINIDNHLDEPIGNYIARLKVSINKKCGMQVFEHGFNDQIITNKRSLDVIFRYIKDNPHRLAVRYDHPEYFRRINEVEIAGRRCSAYGNLQLLQNPFKEQVVCHRADTEETKRSKREQWIYIAANGGVLVSPFISPSEKDIRKEAEEAGGKIMLISNRLMCERDKPSAHDFELCEQGRMLIITPHGLPESFSRQSCLEMNALAAQIATF